MFCRIYDAGYNLGYDVFGFGVVMSIFFFDVEYADNTSCGGYDMVLAFIECCGVALAVCGLFGSLKKSMLDSITLCVWGCSSPAFEKGVNL